MNDNQNVFEIEPGKWISTIEDAGDGSGDGIVALPSELLEELGWTENTDLVFSVLDDGSIEIKAV